VAILGGTRRARPWRRRSGANALVVLLSSLLSTCGQDPPHEEATLVADTGEVASTGFLGFGAQWDATAYIPNGMTEADHQVIERRIRWMHLPVVRKMMLTQWVLVADDVFDFDTQAMALLYRQLDVCRREGIAVVLTDWGCEQSWNKAPGIRDTADLKYARAIGTYLDHLVNRRGYTVIKYLVVVNEPNFEVRDFTRWSTGVANVRVELARRGLDQAVKLLGPDHSYAESWLYRSVDELRDLFGGYDIHRYETESNVRTGRLEGYFTDQWSYARSRDPQAEGKVLVVGEAGLSDGVTGAGGNPNIATYGYGLSMADYGVQAARAGSHAIIAWLLDDDGFLNSHWGLWADRSAGLALRPWFYPWSLFTRYVPPGSTVYRPSQPSPDLRVLVARAPSGEWTFYVVNRADRAARLVVKAPDGAPRAFRIYQYSQESTPKDADGFPVPIGTSTVAPEVGLELSVPPTAVVVATSLNP